MKLHASRIAIITALTFTMAACGGGDDSEPTATPGPAPSSSAAPTQDAGPSGEVETPGGEVEAESAYPATGAKMPLKPSKAPADWVKTDIDGKATIWLPEGYKLFIDDIAPRSAAAVNVSVVTNLGDGGDAPSVEALKKNADTNGIFPEGVPGYVPASATFDWPDTDGAFYARQNVGGGNVTSFLLAMGDDRLSFVVSHDSGSDYQQAIVDKVLSTIVVK